MIRRPLLLCCLIVLLCPRPARATASFAYEWREGPVTVRWREGNRGGNDAAVRGLVGHWKRLAVTAWSPAQAPLTLDVTLYGPELGSGPPGVRLASGDQALFLAASPPGKGEGPITDARLSRALARLKGDSGRLADGLRPPTGQRGLADDGHPRLSPDGRWVAFRAWRDRGPEIRLASVDGREVLRAAPPEAMPGRPDSVAGPLIEAGPEWSPDGRRLLWVQGGRVCVADLRARAARLVTDAAASAVAASWSPRSGLAVVEQEDGGVLLLDLARERGVPFHTLLPECIAQGDYHWSPSGRRLLFRARGGISQANFRTPSATLSWLERLARLFTGRGADPEPALVAGDYGDRLAVLDLAKQTLATVALQEGTDRIIRIDGALWSADEQQVYFAAPEAEERASLWQFDLPSMRLREILAFRPLKSWPEPLLPVEWRHGDASVPRPPRRPPLFSLAGLTLVAGDGVWSFRMEGDAFAAQGPVEQHRLPAGPDGGYRGVEDEEEETEDEPGLWFTLEERAESTTGGDRSPRPPPLPRPAAYRFPIGIYVHADREEAPWLQVLQEIERGGIVDLDIDAGTMTAVLARSSDGGVGALLTVNADGRAIPLADVLAAAPVTDLLLEDAPLPLTGARTGLAALASDLRAGVGGRRLWVAVLAIVVVAAVVLFRLRRRSPVSGALSS